LKDLLEVKASLILLQKLIFQSSLTFSPGFTSLNFFHICLFSCNISVALSGLFCADVSR